MKYEIPTNLDYAMLATNKNPSRRLTIETYDWIGCNDIKSCIDCVLSSRGLTCPLTKEYTYSEETLNRLIEYKVITKVQALDLMLKGEE